MVITSIKDSNILCKTLLSNKIDDYIETYNDPDFGTDVNLAWYNDERKYTHTTFILILKKWMETYPILHEEEEIGDWKGYILEKKETNKKGNKCFWIL